MIDYNALTQAYKDDGFYALQLEVGDLCYQGCVYCYMNAIEEVRNTLTDNQIQQLITDSASLNITAIEWLGGEPLLRDSIFEFMSFAADLNIRNNVWTGGLPLTDSTIRKQTAHRANNGLISIHLSTINPGIYKILHPEKPVKNLYSIISSVRNLLEEGYPADQLLNSVTFTGLQTAEDMIETIDYFEEEFKVKTSLNVYHTYLRPGTPYTELQRFIPNKKDVEKVYRRYSEQWGVKMYPMNCVNKQYCSATLAVLCDGSVTPCATIRPADAPNIHNNISFPKIVNENLDWLIFKKFKEKKYLPKDCQNCELNEECFGCRSRAYAANLGIYGKDPRCYKHN
jgi:radical SAM protein with 4Fe4S-binding SPASM domain